MYGFQNEETTHRDEWLAPALEAVATKGHAKLCIHGFVKRLGVTRGSFHWHQ